MERCIPNQTPRKLRIRSNAIALGISAFTIVFAAGQIVGPVALGAISDGVGLSRGFVYSATILLFSGLLAMGQKPLTRA